MASTDPEAPEADALEQAQSVGDDDEATALPKPKMSFEVPEADALEQAQEVTDDEDDWR